ncbi:hypothetical protein [Riemerella anatipestifer]|uniref:Uncharacterized protein n=1 Tax=Riemerella anatipestifer RA-CH-1 TaxID=1228997 RepID=J9R844_RIEAN|nr:hypothetical protein [Riemerella anatipestifer]AFR35897.1 hypothetical protein B739_1299 [Riemerella anatipestifer RA-CH-1]MCU7560189.1 hypothetical protein [Riemerella anatipestifer]MCU7581592.1 hypothetical protein [Riemerella anatipestifer]MDD1548745.1 hypothetical protein [Riemerella anatipestifer]MDD1550131.1 hypothetical protein [Riemerella anatipestifer]
MLNTFWNNFVYLFGSLFTTSAYLVREKPVYNEDFMSKFTNEKDKKKLDAAVAKLKAGVKTEETITLENKEEVTITIR